MCPLRLSPPHPSPHSTPRDFLHQLHDDVTRLEFAHYDHNGDGFLLGVDFANSIAAAADVRHVDKFLDKARAGRGGGAAHWYCRVLPLFGLEVVDIASIPFLM